MGLAKGECLSPLLYCIFTHGLPAVIEGQGGVKTLLYADDLAVCAGDLVSMQEAMNRLDTFCTDNKLAVNVGKTKSVKFRRGGGALRKSDIYTTKIDGVVCPPNISETVAVRTVKLAHRPRIASTTIKFISKPILLSIL